MSTIILGPKSPARRRATLPSAAPAVAVPSRLCKAVEAAQTVEDAALATGAAVATLDTVVRRDEKWAGAWRQRLALAAAAVTARQAGRSEDEAALRDSLLLTCPGDFLPPDQQTPAPPTFGCSPGAGRQFGRRRLF